MENILKQILTKLESLDEGQKSLAESQKSFDERLSSFDGRLSSFDERLSSFDGRLSSFDERLSSFDERLSSFDERLSSFDGRLSSFDERQKELNDVVTAIRHGQEITHAKLEAITMDVRKLQGDIESLKEHEKDMEFVRRIRQAASDMN